MTWENILKTTELESEVSILEWDREEDKRTGSAKIRWNFEARPVADAVYDMGIYVKEIEFEDGTIIDHEPYGEFSIDFRFTMEFHKYRYGTLGSIFPTSIFFSKNDDEPMITFELG